MMRIFSFSILCAATLMLISSAAFSADETSSVSPSKPQTPLVVIRIKDQPVPYQSAVAKAAKRALDIKPSTLFTIRKVMSPNANSATKARMESEASAVSDVLLENHVPQHQIVVESAAAPESPDPKLDMQELQIFVQ